MQSWVLGAVNGAALLSLVFTSSLLVGLGAGLGWRLASWVFG